MNQHSAGGMDVVVVGGGAIGLCCAYGLASRGARVTLLERDACGGAASSGNAGWVTPALSAPLPAPGVMRDVVRWAFQKDRPLRISPRLDPAFLWWLFTFWRHSRPFAYEAGARAMFALSSKTLESFAALQSDGVDFEIHESGLTFVALSEGELAKYSDSFSELSAFGYSGEVALLSGVEMRALEPALSPATVGAVHAVEERHVRPETFTSGMRAACLQTGVTVLEQTPVQQLELQGDRVGVRLRERLLVPDAVVVAGGVWTRALLATISLKLPIESAKGYSITVEGPPPISRAMYLGEARIGVSPFQASTRVAGTLELTGLDSSVDPRRLDSLSIATRRYLPAWSAGEAGSAWSGLRPLAPDGLPIIGCCSAYDNLYVATAHGMLGITLAPVTGEALAAVVAEEAGGAELAPFTPDRFERTRRRQSTPAANSRNPSATTQRSER
jgi:D-amino-acid dehydrogenase